WVVLEIEVLGRKFLPRPHLPAADESVKLITMIVRFHSPMPGHEQMFSVRGEVESLRPLTDARSPFRKGKDHRSVGIARVPDQGGHFLVDATGRQPASVLRERQAGARIK